jgi:phage shock protein A
MNPFGWLKKRFTRKAKVGRDPLLRVFDERVDELERRAAELRLSAATLLATRGDLERGKLAADARAAQCRTRSDQAKKSEDAHGQAVLVADAEAATTEAEGFAKQMMQVDEDARAITETVRKLESELASLRQERAGAEARLTAAAAVTGASRALAEKAYQIRELDEARDGVEKAKALADVYREDLSRKR